MLYIMPKRSWDEYSNGGQARLLRKTASAISARYSATEVYPDTLVVVVQYTNFKIEVQPVFRNDDGSFTYPYTKNGGSWRNTKPQDELDATAEVNNETNGNLRHLSKMARAWRNKHGVVMGGLLIDTLSHNFLCSTSDFDQTGYGSCGRMMRDFLEFLSEQPKQERYAALGSGQHVKVYKRFEAKAKKALELADKALEAGEDSKANNRWRKVFGHGYPLAEKAELKKAYIVEAGHSAHNTEEFIEDQFPVDIRYPLRLECQVTQNGFQTFFLRASRAVGIRRLSVYKSKLLKFYVASHDIPGRFDIYWKILNRGSVAIQRDMIRGRIEKDFGNQEKKETSDFRGEHVVDCYAVKNGVVIAKDRIHVPIVDVSE